MKKLYILFLSVLLAGCSSDTQHLERAEKALESQNTGKAIQELEKVKQLPQAQQVQLHTLYMQQYPDSIQKDSVLTGSFLSALQAKAITSKEPQSQDGMTVNADGDVTELQDVHIDYDANHQFSRITWRGQEVFSNFDYSKDSTEYILTLGNALEPVWEKEVKDAEGHLVETETEEEGVIRYAYHDNGNGRILESSEWHRKDDTSYTWTYTYEDGKLFSKEKSSKSEPLGIYRRYTYDENGEVQQEREYSDLIHLDYSKTYTYYCDDVVSSEQIVTEKEEYTRQWDLFHTSCTILDKEGKEIGQGWYIPKCGWIVVY